MENEFMDTFSKNEELDVQKYLLCFPIQAFTICFRSGESWNIFRGRV